MRKITQNRSLLAYLFLSLITIGIYAIYFWYATIRDLNEMLKSDGKKTPQIWWVILLFIPTLTLFPLLWHYELGRRLQTNLRARKLPCGFGGGVQLLLVLFGRQCPLLSWIAQYNVIHACNALAAQHNLAIEETKSIPASPFPASHGGEKAGNDLYW